MKLRLLTGLAATLMLGGCATYDYVDRGGGYYVGSSPYQGQGTIYGSYGYGGYGSSYLGYRYRPGWSYGLDYGYPYSWHPYLGYGYGNSHGYGARPPYQRPYPPYPGRPNHNDNNHRPDRPVRPPTAGQRPPNLDRAPWRDLDRLGRHEQHDGAPPRRAMRYQGQEGTGLRHAEGAGDGGSMRYRPQAPRTEEQRMQRSTDAGRTYVQARPAGAGDGAPVRYRPQAPRTEDQQRMRPPPQQRERASRSSSDSPGRLRTETPDTPLP